MSVDYRGVDPYDALRGTRVPSWLRATPRRRQAVVQLRKRAPVDLAPLLGIEPFVMAKSLGCFLAAAARRAGALQALERSSDAEAETARRIVDELRSCEGNVGAGAWGYEFDVQTRWAFYPRGSANLIATVFVARGLLEAGTVFGRDEWTSWGADSAKYLVGGLLSKAGSIPYFRYTETSERLVHNANLLGAGLSAIVGALADDPSLVSAAVDAATTSIAAQAPDGSWPYGDFTDLGWADSFHTAYNLDGLLSVWLATEDQSVRDSLMRGAEFWTSHFFGEDGAPGYYASRQLPYDVHSGATAVDVASRLASHGLCDPGLAPRVATWMRSNLVDEGGCTRFRRGRLFTDRRHFVRWGDAHWALAVGSEQLAEADTLNPLEALVVKRRASLR